MDIYNDNLNSDLRQNTVNIRTLMENSSDLIIKYAKIAGYNAAIICCEGMISTDTLANMVFRPLNLIKRTESMTPESLMEALQNDVFVAVSQVKVEKYDDLSYLIMSGFAVLIIEGIDHGIALGVQGFKTRGIEQVTTHQNLRSSRESFNEVVRTNMSLIRRRVKSPSLVMKIMKLGDRSHTDVCVCYLKDKANPELISGVVEKLERVGLNIVLESGYLQPFLESSKNHIFSEVGVTERPDSFVAKLYDGRIGVIIDGTPFAIYVPKLFIENFQTMDDYTSPQFFVAFIRFIKYFAFAFTTTLPGFYVAMANFNPELIPNPLLFNLLVSVQSTPFPLVFECLIVHVMYEIMREAGIRLPVYTGHVVSIVGGLVIGDILISAGLVGAPMLLIVAISAISSFIIPDLYESIVIIRFGFIFAGGFFGLYGLTIFGVIVLIKIFSMSNYGVPYTAPLAPMTFRGLRDFLYRAGWRTLVKNDLPIDKMRGVHISKEHEKS